MWTSYVKKLARCYATRNAVANVRERNDEQVPVFLEGAHDAVLVPDGAFSGG